MKKHLLFSVATISLTLVAVLAGGASAQAASTPKTLRSNFQVSIDQRGNPAQLPLLVTGILTVDVDPGTGSFTGTLTPGYGSAPGDSVATLASSVLFSNDEGTLTSLNRPSLEVRGQMTGRAINVVILNVDGPGKNIYGVGTAENDPGKGFTNGPGTFGGAAVGPEQGDRGDWVALTISTCTSYSLFGYEIYKSCVSTTIN